MKRTFLTLTLTLTLAAQIVAVGAFAQTVTTTTGTTRGTTGLNAMPVTFGSDWSSTLGPAMFDKSGTTLRAESDLASQWESLSDDDKDMIRRDCMLHELHTNATTGRTGASAGTTMGATGTISGSPTAGSGPVLSVSMERMEEICDATNDL